MNADWWLKVRRADKHMVDIKQEAVRYASSNPYSFTRMRLPDSKQEIRGRFHITQQPDPMIAAMLGDFVHNLRSALDYVIVACVPKKRRKHAFFPILFKDIFAKDEYGDFVVKDSCSRNNCEAAIEGIHPKARACIIDLQPYQTIHVGLPIDDHILGIISRLENADKHRQLITVGCGGQDFTISFTVRGFTETFTLDRLLATGEQFLKNNTVIPYAFPFDGLRYPDGTPIQPPDMEMHLTGTAKILVEIPKIGGNQVAGVGLIDGIMDMAIRDVTAILQYLERFVC